MAIRVGLAGLVSASVISITGNPSQRVFCKDQAVIVVISIPVNPGLVICDADDISASVIVHAGHEAILGRHGNHASCTIIGIGNAAAVGIVRTQDIPVAVIGVMGGGPAAVCIPCRQVKDSILGIAGRIPPPVRL